MSTPTPAITTSNAVRIISPDVGTLKREAVALLDLPVCASNVSGGVYRDCAFCLLVSL